MAIADLPNLVRLEIAGDVALDDSILRAWSKRVRDDDGGGTVFPKLRKLFLYTAKPTFRDYLSYVGAFPALQVLVYHGLEGFGPGRHCRKAVGPWQLQSYVSLPL